MTISEMSKAIHENAAAKGFWDKERNIGEMLMLIVSEISEALEADRKNRYSPYPSDSDMLHMKIGSGISSEIGKTIFEANYKDTFEDELADACIRIFDLAYSRHIDLDWHIKNKMIYNSSRERMHGKKY